MASCKKCGGSGTVIQPICGYTTDYSVTCTRCHGTGSEPTSTCPACGGTGKSKIWYNWGNTCEKCHGSGKY